MTETLTDKGNVYKEGFFHYHRPGIFKTSKVTGTV